MFEYTIAAIPTTHNGVKYRSRLEARWAAFFDLLGWRHTYEPYDMGVWSPDFIVRTGCDGHGAVLVEVKPIETPCDDTLKRMLRACTECGAFSEESDIMGAILVGVAPTTKESLANGLLLHARHQINVGWLVDRLTKDRRTEESEEGVEPSQQEIGLGWVPGSEKPEMTPDFIHICPYRKGWFTVTGGEAGVGWGQAGPPVYPYAEYTMGLWKKACNAVQWRGRGT